MHLYTHLPTNILNNSFGSSAHVHSITIIWIQIICGIHTHTHTQTVCKRKYRHLCSLQGHLYLLTHKQSPELVCVCAPVRTLSSMIRGLVFSSVRFRNAHSLHNSSRSEAGKKGWWREGAHIYVREHPALLLSEGITGENLCFSHWYQHLRYDASKTQFSPLFTAFGSIFSAHWLNYMMKHVHGVAVAVKDSGADGECCHFFHLRGI